MVVAANEAVNAVISALLGDFLLAARGEGPLIDKPPTPSYVSNARSWSMFATPLPLLEKCRISARSPGLRDEVRT
jgi:hypothetical protein